MRAFFVLVLSLIPAALSSQEPGSFREPARVIDSIPGPESVAIGPDGAWYVSAFGKFDNKADGAIYRIDPDKGTRELFAGGLEDPCGVVFVGDTLWAADRQGVYRIRRGKAELVYPTRSFPRKLNFLNDLAAGPGGTLYVSDTGDSTRAGHGAIFRIAPGRRPTILPGSDTVRAQSSVNGLFRAGDTLYAVGYRTGVLSVTDGRGNWKQLATGLGAPDGIEPAGDNAFYISDNVGGDLFLVDRRGSAPPKKLAQNLKAPADLIVDRARGLLIIPENEANRLSIYRLGRHASH